MTTSHRDHIVALLFRIEFSKDTYTTSLSPVYFSSYCVDALCLIILVLSFALTVTLLHFSTFVSLAQKAIMDNLPRHLNRNSEVSHCERRASDGSVVPYEITTSYTNPCNPSTDWSPDNLINVDFSTFVDYLKWPDPTPFPTTGSQIFDMRQASRDHEEINLQADALQALSAPSSFRGQSDEKFLIYQSATNIGKAPVSEIDQVFDPSHQMFPHFDSRGAAMMTADTSAIPPTDAWMNLTPTDAHLKGQPCKSGTESTLEVMSNQGNNADSSSRIFQTSDNFSLSEPDDSREHHKSHSIRHFAPPDQESFQTKPSSSLLGYDFTGEENNSDPQRVPQFDFEMDTLAEHDSRSLQAVSIDQSSTNCLQGGISMEIMHLSNPVLTDFNYQRRQSLRATDNPPKEPFEQPFSYAGGLDPMDIDSHMCCVPASDPSIGLNWNQGSGITGSDDTVVETQNEWIRETGMDPYFLNSTTSTVPSHQQQWQSTHYTLMSGEDDSLEINPDKWTIYPPQRVANSPVISTSLQQPQTLPYIGLKRKQSSDSPVHMMFEHSFAGSLVEEHPKSRRKGRSGPLPKSKAQCIAQTRRDKTVCVNCKLRKVGVSDHAFYTHNSNLNIAV